MGSFACHTLSHGCFQNREYQQTIFVSLRASLMTEENTREILSPQAISNPSPHTVHGKRCREEINGLLHTAWSLTILQSLLESDENGNSKSSCHLENKQLASWWGTLPESMREWPGKPRFTEITRKLMASWSLHCSQLHYNTFKFLFISARNKGSQVCPVLAMYQVPNAHESQERGIIRYLLQK